MGHTVEQARAAGPLVVALGGNALKTEPDSRRVRGLPGACRTLAGFSGTGLVITHGSGPQLGMLASAQPADGKAPLDILDAEVEGWLGYLVEQELANALQDQCNTVTVLTRVEVSASDPAFTAPTKPIGPWLSKPAAERLAARHGWQFIAENDRYRRTVASPAPRQILQAEAIGRLLRSGYAVIAAGGGGIPVAQSESGQMTGVDAVIDKDLASALLGIQLQARLLVMATDVAGIFRNWPDQYEPPIDIISASELDQLDLPPGSMGPKAEAAVQFVNATGKSAVIGALEDLSLLLEQRAGTRVVPDGNL